MKFPSSPFLLFQSRSASGAVEFAIIAPLMLLMTLGISAWGIYLAAAHSVQQIAADATRAAIAGLDAAERRSLAEGFVNGNAGAYVFIDPARVSVATADAAPAAGQFQVTVSFDASGLPVWTLMKGIPMPESLIVRRSTIRIGGI